MTFSVVARSADGLSWGVAVASKYLAAAAAVAAAEAGVGAVATQSFVNVTYKPRGLRLMREGASAQEALDALTGTDEGRQSRQAGIVDAQGRAATWTGSECMDWAGGVTGDGYAIQGNILAGPHVVEAMERAWLDSDPAAPLEKRLLASLVAGDVAGGDRRGRQSAGLIVVAGGVEGVADAGHREGVVCDLRVDDHPDPCGELSRLVDLHELYFGRPDPASLLPLQGALHDEVRDRLGRLGFSSLDDWAGMENYEERLVDGAIDPVVLGKLREATA